MRNYEYIARTLEKINKDLGENVINFLEETDVVEIILNSDGQLWIERIKKGFELVGPFCPKQAHALINTLASYKNTVVNPQNPIIECVLPQDGSRFIGLVPPIVSSPSFCIRRKAIQVFAFESYVAQNIMTQLQAQKLRQAISQRRNILISGSTGSGKTTFANACIAFIAEYCSTDRLVVLEDTPEIQCRSENVETMCTTDHVDMLRLLKCTMRMRPDRIIVGEVRGGEALVLLKAWMTGHPGGIATIHADNAECALVRLESLISEAILTPQQSLIAQAVDVVVHIDRTPQGRAVTEMIAVKAFKNGTYITESLLV